MEDNVPGNNLLLSTFNDFNMWRFPNFGLMEDNSFLDKSKVVIFVILFVRLQLDSSSVDCYILSQKVSKKQKIEQEHEWLWDNNKNKTRKKDNILVYCTSSTNLLEDLGWNMFQFVFT